MATARPVAVAITGAGNANTGLKYLSSIDLWLSAAGTLQIRAGASNGTVYAETTTAAAGGWSRSYDLPLACPQSGTGTWFVVNSAGNVSGGVAGDVG
jgi:hypothetical protein